MTQLHKLIGRHIATPSSDEHNTWFDKKARYESTRKARPYEPLPPIPERPPVTSLGPVYENLVTRKPPAQIRDVLRSPMERNKAIVAKPFESREPRRTSAGRKVRRRLNQEKNAIIGAKR